MTKDLFDKVQNAMKRRSKPTPIRLKSYVYRGLFHCAECGCGITMETQKGHNYLRCTKRVKKDCSQPYLREEAATEQIATILTKASLPDEVADWMIERLDAEREEGAMLIREAKKNVEKRIEKIDQQLDRLTTAYLDAGAFSAAEFRKRKEETLNRKRKLLDDLAALDRDENKRFEPLKRFVNGSKQMKYVAKSQRTDGIASQARRSRFEPHGSRQKTALVAPWSVATCCRSRFYGPRQCRGGNFRRGILW